MRVKRVVFRSTFARLTVAQGFTNLGAIELTQAGPSNTGYDARLGIASGTLVNARGANIKSLTGVRGGNRQLDGQLDNQGTLVVEQTLNAGTFLNLDGTTLTGGTYLVFATLRFPNATITTDAATIVLDGAAARIANQFDA